MSVINRIKDSSKKNQFLICWRLLYVILGIAMIVNAFINPEYYYPTDAFRHFIVYISFFTNQSNLIAFGVMIIGLFYSLRKKESIFFDRIRLGAVTYLTLTMVVFQLIIAPLIPNPHTLGSLFYHLFFPLMLIIDWLISPSIKPLSTLKSLVYVIYPLIYLFWTQIIGSIYNWYPYFFIDPTKISLLFMATNIIILLIFILILSNIYNYIPKLYSKELK
jgi:hypothetical protein